MNVQPLLIIAIVVSFDYRRVAVGVRDLRGAGRGARGEWVDAGGGGG